MNSRSAPNPAAPNTAVHFDISALDPSFKDHTVRGIGRYVQELNNYFKQNEKSLSLPIRPFSRTELSRENIPWQGLVKRAPILRNVLEQQIVLPKQLAMKISGKKISGNSFFHFPAHMDAPSWGVSRYVLTVLDTIPLLFKSLYAPQAINLRYQVARYLERCSISKASLLLAISECTARDINRVLGVPLEKIVVTPLGVGDQFRQLCSADLMSALRYKLNIEQRTPIISYVGGIDPRKNVIGLLKVFCEVQKVIGETAVGKPAAPSPILVLAGRMDRNREYPELLQSIEKFGLRDSVRLTGYLSDQELCALYQTSSTFLFLSRYEGFGLPVLEAMACGVPIVASNNSSIPEVLGEAGMLVDPDNIEEATRAVLHLLGSSELRNRLIASGKKRSLLFSWEKTGEKTVQAYESLLRPQVQQAA